MGTERALFEAEVVGWREANRVLNDLDRSVRTEVYGGLEGTLKAAASEAAGRINRVSGASARGYRVSRSGRGVAIRNSARGAVISEFAGALHPQGVTPRGRTLISTLNARYGEPGRLAWAAVDRRRAQIDAQVQATVEAIERRYRMAL